LRKRVRASFADDHDDGAPGRSVVGTAFTVLCRELVAELAFTGATVTVMGADGHHGLVAASDEEVRALDALQFDLGEGPSREAFATRRPVLVDELGRHGARGPGFASASAAAGGCAVHAFPLQLGASRLGVLTAYCDRPRSLTRAELWACATYVEVATELLIDTTSGALSDGGPERFLEHDVELRTDVYQAQGMVMVALGVSLTEALALLRARAFAEGLDLNTLAADIVVGRRSPHPEPERRPSPEPPDEGDTA
jgi:hypothetical protein